MITSAITSELTELQNIYSVHTPGELQQTCLCTVQFQVKSEITWFIAISEYVCHSSVGRNHSAIEYLSWKPLVAKYQGLVSMLCHVCGLYLIVNDVNYTFLSKHHHSVKIWAWYSHFGVWESVKNAMKAWFRVFLGKSRDQSCHIPYWEHSSYFSMIFPDFLHQACLASVWQATNLK